MTPAKTVQEIDAEIQALKQRKPATKSKRGRFAGERELRRQQLAAQPGRSPMVTGPLQSRAAAGPSQSLVEVTGTVIVYGVPYEVYDPFGSFQETIHYGAAAACLADPELDVRFLYGHDSSSLMPLARTGALTSLTLTDTPAGLTIRALIDPRQSVAADLVIALSNGVVNQMSVGMVVDPDGDHWSGADEYGVPNVRNITSLSEILDVSAVAYPASPTTEIMLGSGNKPDNEWPALQSDPDGTNGNSGTNDPGLGNEDGTGSRSALIEIDMDMTRFRIPPHVH